MKIEVRYFAALREVLGGSEILDMPAGTPLKAVRDTLIARSERHAEALSRRRLLRCALDQRLCEEDDVLPAGAARAEVAFFPPVTGG
jgi:molybdopterin synthase sulfur carrier subunit